MRFLTFAIAATFTFIAFARAADTPPDLTGAWLLDSVSGLPPHSTIRCRLTATKDALSLTGCEGLSGLWNGKYELGPDGSMALHADPHDPSSLGTSPSYPSGDVHAIYKFEPSADGDRLTVCFPTRTGVARPTTFTATGDLRVVSFIRVGNTFPDWPKDVVVTVLDPGGKPAAKASIFQNANRNHETQYDASVKGFIVDQTSPLTWRYSEVATTGSDGTAKMPYTAFENAAGFPNAAHAP